MHAMKAGRFPIIVLAALALLFANAASAAQILPTTAPKVSPSPAPSVGPTIETEAANNSDARIARRIRGIFSELPSLAHVTVKVQQGVVTLGGAVENPADKAKAEGIAGRVAGVVTVENKIARDTSVGSGVAGLKKVSDKFAGLVGILPLLGAAVLAALLIGAVGYFIAGLRGLWLRVARNPFLAELIASAIRFVFVLGGIIIALDMLGAGTLLGAVLGGAGVVGLALGFAMRDTIENYVSSLMLSLRQPFQANDLVRIDNCEGRVVRLTTRATILMTTDGNHLRVPNSTVFKAVILNFTRNPHRRFDFVLQIDFRADPNKARDCGFAALDALDFVLKDPAPAAVVQEAVYPFISIQYLAWLDQTKSDFGKGRSQALAAVKQALEEQGLAPPDPVTHVYMEREEPPRTPPVAPPPELSQAAEHDVAPEKAIREMVEKERAETGGGKKDLLDSSRPQE
jgi:small-conductance mechanosensitive channel